MTAQTPARRFASFGYIDDVNPDDAELTASFDGRAVTYGFGELDMLVPAYAASIHKSQGSEYPAVVIPAVTQQGRTSRNASARSLTVTCELWPMRAGKLEAQSNFVPEQRRAR